MKNCVCRPERYISMQVNKHYNDKSWGLFKIIAQWKYINAFSISICASLTILAEENYSRQTISFTADESGPLQKRWASLLSEWSKTKPWPLAQLMISSPLKILRGSFAVQMLRGLLSLISLQIFQVDLWKAKRCGHGRQHPGAGERMGFACLGMRWEGIKG